MCAERVHAACHTHTHTQVWNQTGITGTSHVFFGVESRPVGAHHPRVAPSLASRFNITCVFFISAGWLIGAEPSFEDPLRFRSSSPAAGEVQAGVLDGVVRKGRTMNKRLLWGRDKHLLFCVRAAIVFERSTAKEVVGRGGGGEGRRKSIGLEGKTCVAVRINLCRMQNPIQEKCRLCMFFFPRRKRTVHRAFDDHHQASLCRSGSKFHKY